MSPGASKKADETSSLLEPIQISCPFSNEYVSEQQGSFLVTGQPLLQRVVLSRYGAALTHCFVRVPVTITSSSSQSHFESPIIITSSGGQENTPVLDVVTGFDDPDATSRSPGNPYFGAVIGRLANRVDEGGQITRMSDKALIQLDINNGPNSLHGGLNGLDKQFWTVRAQTPHSATLSYISPHGESGYPGTVEFTAHYEITAQGALEMCLSARLILDNIENEDEETWVSMTTHPYWNLSGFHDPTITSHHLWIPNCLGYLELTDHQIPTGRVVQPGPGNVMFFGHVDGDGIGLPFGRGIPSPSTITRGYDHFYLVDSNPVTGEDETGSHLVAVVTCPSSHLRMDVFTDAPGFQLYTGNWLDGSIPMKRGSQPPGGYGAHAGYCIEPGQPPNAVNTSLREAVTLCRDKPTWQMTCSYHFSPI